jgi:hypothetical protein
MLDRIGQHRRCPAPRRRVWDGVVCTGFVMLSVPPKVGGDAPEYRVHPPPGLPASLRLAYRASVTGTRKTRPP